MKSLYNPLLYAYMIIGIDIFEKKDKRLKACRYIMRFTYHIIATLGVVTGAFHFGFFCDGFDMDIVFPILYIYTGLLFLFIMNKRRENLRQIINVLTKIRMDMKYEPLIRSVIKKFILINIALIFLVWVLFVILIYHIFVTESFAKVPSKLHMWFSWMKNIFSYVSIIYSISLFITTYFCCFLPSFIYCNMYILVSWHLKNILTEVNNTILSSPLDFRSNHQLYIQISHLIEFVDSKLKYPSVFHLLHFGIFTYFLIFSNFLKEPYFESYKIVTSILLIATLFAIIKAIDEAGEIPVINLQILSTVTEMPLDDHFHSHRIIFIEKIKQKLSLTIAGIVPLTKGWSAVVISTILTYSVLIKTL